MKTVASATYFQEETKILYTKRTVFMEPAVYGNDMTFLNSGTLKIKPPNFHFGNKIGEMTS